MVHFVRRIKEIHPDLMVSQPTYGYPQVTGCEEKIFAGNRNKNILGGHKNICRAQVQAEIDVINASWNPGGTSNGLADTIGLMVYEGDQVSCDWWRADHVTTVLTSDWSRRCSTLRTTPPARSSGRGSPYRSATPNTDDQKMDGHLILHMSN